MTQSLFNPLLNSLFFFPHTGSKFKELREAVGRSNQYVLLVPRTSVLEWNIDRETMLPMRDLCLREDFVASHIIQVACNARNHQRARYYRTMNGRTVTIKDGYVHTHKGFKTFIRTHIFSEYMLYTASPYCTFNTQFVVYEIDHPLVGIAGPSADISPTISSKYELSVTESPKKSLGINPELDNIPSFKDFEKMMSEHPAIGRLLFGQIIRIIEQFDCSECTTEDDITSLLDDALDLAIDTLHTCDASAISTMTNEYNMTSQGLADMIYRYIEINVSLKLWKQIILIRKDKDQRVREAIKKIVDVDISQIGLGEVSRSALFDFDMLVWEAAKELSKLKAARGAAAKLSVLISTLKILGSGQSGIQLNTEMTYIQPGTQDLKINESGKPIISADLLVSLLVLVVVRSGLDYMDSELYYIKAFSLEDTQSGQTGYVLMTFEAIMVHIVTESDKLEIFSKANRELWNSVGIEGSDNLMNILNDLEQKFSKDDKLSIIHSRTRNGDSLLMQCIQNKNYKALSKLLDLDLFPIEYIIGDTNELGRTLFIASVQSEDQNLITEVLGIVLGLNEEEQRRYLSRTDFWKRTVAHYFVNAPWLISKIGHLIDWTVKDLNGQTPLYTLFRCYDYPEYSKLVHQGLEGWRSSTKQPRMLDHTDYKGNTLLHIIKSAEGLESILKYQVDINWPNDKGLTPAMSFSKFSRSDVLEVILNHQQLDIGRIDGKGLRCLDIAKDSNILSLLDDYILNKDYAVISSGHSVITRTEFFDNELRYVVVTKVKSSLFEDDKQDDSKEMITHNRRTLADFQFLQKWLSHENPFSWVPTITAGRNPFSVPTRVSRQLIRETETRLNAFLRYLLLHPAFGSHELLWEFLLLPEVDQQRCIDRSRKKLESRKEFQIEHGTHYEETDLEPIEIFLAHARQQMVNIGGCMERLANKAIHMRNKEFDVASAKSILEIKFGETEFFKPFLAGILPEFDLAIGIFDSSSTDFFLDLSCMVETFQTVINAISLPLNLIEQLKEQKLLLGKYRTEYEKNVDKNGWTGLHLFVEKQKKSQQQLEDRIKTTTSDIQRLSNDIHLGHVTLASELGGFHELREKELRHVIETFTRGVIIREKERHMRFERALYKFRQSQ